MLHSMFHLRMNWIAICIAIAWVQPSAISYAQLASQLDPLIRNHQGEVAVAIKNLDTGELYQHNETTVMPTASLIKFPVLVELYRQVDAGKLRLDHLVTLQDSDKVPGSGILTDHFQSGSQIPLETIARLMIRYSDNTATNLVLDQIGMENTSKTMLQLGFRETRLHSKVFRRDTSVAPERSQKYGLGSTTAAEMLGLLELLHAKMLVSEKASEQMLAHLASCDDDSKLVRNLPKSVKSFHKTGSVNDVRTDAGLFQTAKGTLAIVVLTAKNQDTSWGNANAAELLCAKIGSAAYEWFNPPGTSTAVKPEVVKIGASGDTVKALQRTLNEKLSPSRSDSGWRFRRYDRIRCQTLSNRQPTPRNRTGRYQYLGETRTDPDRTFRSRTRSALAGETGGGRARRSSFRIVQSVGRCRCENREDHRWKPA